MRPRIAPASPAGMGELSCRSNWNKEIIFLLIWRAIILKLEMSSTLNVFSGNIEFLEINSPAKNGLMLLKHRTPRARVKYALTAKENI